MDRTADRQSAAQKEERIGFYADAFSYMLAVEAAGLSPAQAEESKQTESQ
jgi:hypothetical protein